MVLKTEETEYIRDGGYGVKWHKIAALNWLLC